MMYPNFWYKKIPCENYQQINQELLVWCNAHATDLVSRRIGFEHTDIDTLEKVVPTLRVWLDSLNIGSIKMAALVVIGPKKNQSIHIDAQARDFALNFGVQVKGTHTNMFRIIEGTYTTVPYGTQGLVFHSFEHCKLEKETEFTLEDAPVLFNTKHVHQVVNPTYIPRIALSLRFYDDPVHLLNH